MDERRTTYIATTEHLEEVTIDIIDKIKMSENPNCEKVFQSLEKHKLIAERPELYEMYDGLHSQLFRGWEWTQ